MSSKINSKAARPVSEVMTATYGGGQEGITGRLQKGRVMHRMRRREGAISASKNQVASCQHGRPRLHPPTTYITCLDVRAGVPRDLKYVRMLIRFRTRAGMLYYSLIRDGIRREFFTIERPRDDL